MKWLISLTGKLRVAGALAQALDLLQLPRYAAICRSGRTREILSAYEISTAHRRAAFRQAAAASGITPPDLAEFEWGAAMGVQEASAWSSTAEFLELAVVGGDLVPGRRGGRRSRTCASPPQYPAGRTARADAGPGDPHRARRRNLRRSRPAAGSSPRSPTGCSTAQSSRCDGHYPLPRLRWLLDQLNAGIALTQTGNLSQKFVQQSADRFGWDFSRQPRTEDDLFDLSQLRHLAQRLRLARRSGRMLTLTAKGRHLLTDPRGLCRAVAVGLLDENYLTAFAGELFLALLLDADSVPDGEIKATVGRAVAEEGFRESRTGELPDEYVVSRLDLRGGERHGVHLAGEPDRVFLGAFGARVQRREF